MSPLRQSLILFACSLMLMATGCVGPMACGPCGGPLALNSCDGCGECEGCGELYIDPWINEPADACDPCDKCGNYNGQSCGKCRSVFDGFASFWGYRCEPGCDDCSTGGCDVPLLSKIGCDAGCDQGCCDAGCCDSIGLDPVCGCEASCGCDSSCGGACNECGNGSDGIYLGGDSLPPGEYVESVPSKAPYKPSRTRQIFKPRDGVAEGAAKAASY